MRVYAQFLFLAAILQVITLPSRVWADIGEGETVDCVIEPARTIRVAATLPGLLTAVTVDTGDKVTVGQILAEQQSKAEARAVDLARLRASDEFDRQSLELQRDMLQRKLRRLTTLNQSDIVADSAREEAETEAAMTLTAIAQADLNHQIAKAELARAEELLDQRRIRSPIDGLVVERVLSPGEYMTESDHVLIISQMDPLRVTAFVPVSLYGRIDKGDSLSVRVGLPVNATIPATVTGVDQVFDIASNTFAIRLDLSNPENNIPAGLRCQLEVP